MTNEKKNILSRKAAKAHWKRFIAPPAEGKLDRKPGIIGRKEDEQKIQRIGSCHREYTKKGT